MFTSTPLLLSQSSHRLTLEMFRLAEHLQSTFTMKEEKQSHLPDGFYQLRCETIVTPGPRLKAFWRGQDKADPLSRLLLEARVFRSLSPCPSPLCLETQCWLSTEEACSEVPRHHSYLLVSFSQVPCPRAPVFLPSPLCTPCLLGPLTKCLSPTYDTCRGAAPTKEVSSRDQPLLSTTVYLIPSTALGI